MLTPFLTLFMYALCFFLLLTALRGAFYVVMGLRERARFARALRRAGL